MFKPVGLELRLMFLLDTNVVSELRKRSKADREVARLGSRRKTAQQLFLSAMTVREIEIGVLHAARK